MESLIEFRKVVFRFNGDVMVIALRINLLRIIYDVTVDKFDFSPVQSPDMRSSRCKKILVQGDEPEKLSVKFLFWGEWGNFGGQKKMKTKIGLLLTLFLNLSNNSTNLMPYRGGNLTILSLKILINY